MLCQIRMADRMQINEPAHPRLPSYTLHHMTDHNLKDFLRKRIKCKKIVEIIVSVIIHGISLSRTAFLHFKSLKIVIGNTNQLRRQIIAFDPSKGKAAHQIHGLSLSAAQIENRILFTDGKMFNTFTSPSVTG